MTDSRDDLISRTVKQVNAIISEAGVTARTGRTRPDVGRVPENASVSSLIDHSLFKVDAMAREIEMLCLQAKQNGFASVCVNSCYVPLACELLKDSNITVSTVVGSPPGASLLQVTVYAAQEAIAAGAREITMVIPIGALKSRDIVGAFLDITDVAAACHEHLDEIICLVTIESNLLDETEIIIACQLAKQAGADFVQTCTDFNSGSATVEAVSLMRRVVGNSLGVKASGGIETLVQAQAMIDAGANRISANDSVRIAQEERGELP